LQPTRYILIHETKRRISELKQDLQIKTAEFQLASSLHHEKPQSPNWVKPYSCRTKPYLLDEVGSVRV
jgi:hypothetical protein